MGVRRGEVKLVTTEANIFDATDFKWCMMTTTEARTAIYTRRCSERHNKCTTSLKLCISLGLRQGNTRDRGLQKCPLKSRRAPRQNTRTHPTSWLGQSALPGVAHKPAGKVEVVAAGAHPITRLELNRNAMRIVADAAPLEVVVPALRAEPIACSKALK